ncbi:UPF0481 protein At3g47200-like [Nicotiana tabacum]|uniref:UPF0481 protein At3g47200-like n=1 Tax=Nicotiana tabacum TaxID=4097 RepID=A0A1S3ZR80_TOBAC|nr:PREDICTED: UPF0481 protein At3g47200-like [Nicotiana tabacum]
MEDISILQYATRFPEIPKIPLCMRLEDQNNDDYDPKVVSLGPYHHGKPELKFVEDFKPVALQMFIHGSDKNQDFFLEKILEEIEDAKSCYYDMEDTCIDDNAFAQMMLLDACFVLNYIEFVNQWSFNYKCRTLFWHLGYGVCSLVRRDMFLLENQVPFGILKLLFNLRFGGCGFEEMLQSYCCQLFFGQLDSRNNVLMEPQPSHLFELLRRALVSGNYQHLEQSHRGFKWRKNNSSSNENRPTITCPLVFRPMMDLISKCIDQYCGNKKEDKPMVTESSDMFHSVMELKSKGVRFMPSGFGSLKAVRFTSHCYYAKLSLPCWYVSEYTRVFFRNMIAYESCPGNNSDCSLSAYIYFMKTLVISPNDAKELREKKIIFNHLGSDEQVVQVFRALKTYVHVKSNYKDVKEQIEEHCNRKSQTWIAQLLDTYFTSPWTLLALFAATSLLFLTILQTYYASPFYSHAKGS